jgi:bacteriorhodopsin
MEVPAWVHRLARRCLAKDPGDRWQTMRDIVIELRSPQEEVVEAPRAKANWWPWAVAGVATLVAGVLLSVMHSATPVGRKASAKST